MSQVFNTGDSMTLDQREAASIAEAERRKRAEEAETPAAGPVKDAAEAPARPRKKSQEPEV